MEKMMLDLVKICQQKEFLCIHDDVDDLIESALDSKLLLINSNCQRLDKKEQEVKIVVEQPAECGNHIAPIQSTKEPEHLLSMGYEHPSINPETKSDEVTESNAENLLPILSKCEDNDNLDFSDDESLPDEDVPVEEFKIYLNPLCDEDKINYDKLDPHCFNVESDFVESLLNRYTFIDFSSKFDFSGELAHIKPEIPKSDFDFDEEIRLIENLLYDNSFPRPPKELNAEIADRIIESIPLPIPVQDGNSQQEEIDIELLIDDFILSHESFDSNFEDNPLIPRPPPEPPDAETNVGEEIQIVMIDKDKFDNDYKIFMFDTEFSLLSTESEDTIFDPEIPKSDFDFEEEIRLNENFLYDNSFPRPPEELNAEIAETIIESIPLLPIPVQDGNSQQEEIDIVTETDDVLPLSVENDDDSSDDPLLGEADLFLSDNSIPPGI
nr:hypothetical protein [Tanacetum cinerariifolium]